MIHGSMSKGAFDSATIVYEKKRFEIVKRWVTKKDSLVRDTHKMMEGVEVGRNELFEVPILTGGTDFMRYPGDRNATIGNWINCRCEIKYRKVKGSG